LLFPMKLLLLGQVGICEENLNVRPYIWRRDSGRQVFANRRCHWI